MRSSGIAASIVFPYITGKQKRQEAVFSIEHNIVIWKEQLDTVELAKFSKNANRYAACLKERPKRYYKPVYFTTSVKCKSSGET
jgi:hypothetical protein